MGQRLVRAKLSNRVIGEELGKYRVLAPIGRGGMATVYVGEHTLLGNRVAIKVLQKRHLDNPAIERRFFNEAKVIAAIRHSNIVEILDYGRSESGAAYIVMELLEGQTLRERIRRGVMPERQSALFMRQLASGLADAHRQGVIHRDLKPDNVFIIADEEVELGERIKLLDFGIAKQIESDAGLGPPSEQTATGILVGTPAYMSPEQCKGLGTIDGRSDIYSLGVVLYRMLTNQLPFEAGGTGELIGKHLFVEPPSPREVNPEVSAEIEAIVLRCLQKEPQHRYRSMGELAGAFGDLLSENTLVRSRPAHSGTHASGNRDGAFAHSTPSGLPYAQHASPMNEGAHPRGSIDTIESSGPTTLGSATGEQQVYQQAGQARNKRWSLLIAAGCVAAMVIGVVALSASNNGNGPAQEAAAASEVGPDVASEAAAEVGSEGQPVPRVIETGVAAASVAETAASTTDPQAGGQTSATEDNPAGTSAGSKGESAARSKNGKRSGRSQSKRTSSDSTQRKQTSTKQSTRPKTAGDAKAGSKASSSKTSNSKTEKPTKPPTRPDPKKTYDDVKPKMLY